MSAPAAAPASAASASSSAAGAAASSDARPSYRRDMLLEIESQVQARWEAAKIWDANAGNASTRALDDKYLATFPFPYMNGVLHLGHGFTLAKVDFECNYQRLKGKNVLFPFGYHCTGMPICAAADKLKREVKKFGLPPQFPAPVEKEEEEAAAPAAAAAAASSAPAAEEKKDEKKKGGKGKVAAKASKETYQWNILREMEVPDSEIGKFQDATHWLSYFPPIATRHLKKFGLSADFRRSFITTSVNPYYDSFIRWHFNTLRRREKIAFGGRLSIFSPLDNQTCADHDRAEGEGVDFQEYALIKLKLLPPYPASIVATLGAAYAGHTVILPAATLRPETMYGQTNAWILPDGEYGAFEINATEVFICSPKSALNMAYQHLAPERGVVKRIGTVIGKELLGCAISAPHARYEKVYLLPLTTIKMDKATGIVTSVPSDAPDDYAALMDLKNKPPFREKYGIKDEQVLPFEVVQIIETPGLGMQPAVDLCIERKVASQNDRVKLDEIKDKVYKEGFAKGIMRVGPYAGQKVSDAKPKIKADMIAAGLAYNYAEPDKRVISRSGCEWYLKYGEPEWQSTVRAHVENVLETYNPQTKKDFLLTVDWLHEWACSRSYGLGTFLPWDQQYVIESLSDSTIYMAYYTIAHMLQGTAAGDASLEAASFLNGSKPGLSGILASELNDDVWNYIFLNKEFPGYPAGKTSIAQTKLDALRNEFEYWYPMDLRVSGKDLIGNHLTMALYNHAAIWPGDAANRWPRSFFTNGHVQIDHEKMSKSTGNFVTLDQAVREYSADATRFALADAGDGLEDANFERKNANAAILKLTKEEMWIKECIEWDAKNPAAKLRTGPLNFFDRVMLNQVYACAAQADACFARIAFREGMKYAWHELSNERDNYRMALKAEHDPHTLHRDVLWKYFEVLAIILSPICPHWSQHVWDMTGIGAQHGIEFIARARWPAPPAGGIDPVLTRQCAYLRDTNASMRKQLMETLTRFGKAPKPKAGEKPIVIDPQVLEIAKNAEGGILHAEQVSKLLTHCTLYFAAEYPEWQRKVLLLITQAWEQSGSVAGVYPDRKVIIPLLKTLHPDAKDKKAMEQSTKFANAVLEDLAVRGAAALELQLPFSEAELLANNMEFVSRDLGVQHVNIKRCEEGPPMPAAPAAGAPAPGPVPFEQQQVAIEALAASKALPGRPSPFFYKQ